MMLKVVVTLLRQLGRLFKQLRFLAQQSGLLIAQVVVKLFELLVVHLLRRFATRPIGGRQLDFNQLGPFLLSLLAIFIFFGGWRDFDVVINDREAAALVLKGIGYGIQLRLYLSDLLIDLFCLRRDGLDGGLGLIIELLIFGILFYFGFGLARLRLYAFQITRVAADKFSLNSF